MKKMNVNELNKVVGGNIESIIEGIYPQFRIGDIVVFRDGLCAVDVVRFSFKKGWVYDINDIEYTHKEIFGVPEKDLQSVR